MAEEEKRLMVEFSTQKEAVGKSQEVTEKALDIAAEATSKRFKDIEIVQESLQLQAQRYETVVRIAEMIKKNNHRLIILWIAVVISLSLNLYNLIF